MSINPIINKCRELHDEGYRIASVTIMRGGANTLRVAISRATFVPCGEGGDLPHHTVTIDRDKMPDGVTLRGFDRCADYIMALLGNEEQAEALIRDVAKEGQSQDWAKFDGSTPDYPHWLTKPQVWQRRKLTTTRRRAIGEI